MAVGVKRRTLDDLLTDAEGRIVRYTPAEAHKATASGALLIDIRSDSDRERDGIVPGSLHIPRTVLEWRTDLDSQWRNPYLEGLDQQIILLCTTAARRSSPPQLSSSLALRAQAT